VERALPGVKRVRAAIAVHGKNLEPAISLLAEGREVASAYGDLFEEAQLLELAVAVNAELGNRNPEDEDRLRKLADTLGILDLKPVSGNG
jgi:hypothetical protein